jgi:signal transduction histidine kinase
MADRLLTGLSWPEGGANHHRISPLIAILLIGFVTFRKLITMFGHPQFTAAVIFLGTFTLLLLTWPAFSHRFGWPRSAYFLIQMGLITTLGLLQPYEDTWGMLFIVLGMQLRELPSPRAAGAWAAAFTVDLLVVMISTLGLLAGLGFSLLVIALTAFFFSYDLHYAQVEASKQESERLLEELQAAHRKLKEYASQAEALAAAQERDRLARELHDSVSQMVFSISLTAESTRMLLAKDSARVPEALERLQELTGRALAHMRALISQWRPG